MLATRRSSTRTARSRKRSAKYEEASKLDPGIATIQLNLGFANLAAYQNDPEAGDDAANKAVAAFEAYLKLKPGDERGTQYLVQTFVDTSRYEAAVDFYKPQIDKKDPEVFNTLGVIASKTGKFARGQGVVRQARRGRSEEPGRQGLAVRRHLGLPPQSCRGRRRSAQELADEGIKYCKAAIDQAPKAPNAYTYTNLLYRERSLADITDDEKRPDLEKANEYFRKAMQLLKEASAAGAKK